ncbi:MAG TPA: ClC family H(+)/Cl(-) exchange transporter, partial [Aminobacteriaceae bacterium]|nr:ClC family H(+)/Cl(-) exchange transporter [Aminobacteriaceae bacterium]
MRRYALLTAGSRFRAHIVFQGIVVGLSAGVASICYRLLLEYAEEFSFRALRGGYSLPLPALLLLWTAVALFIGKLMEKEPMARGSGIPQVEGELMGCVSMNWLRVLWAKFLGGGLAIALGLSLGREGPSVQIGAAVGKGLSRLQKKTKMEEKLLLSSGASAGLAAAFNAPLSGVIFALEEVHKSFSPLILLSAMMASLGADFLSKTFFGLGPVFSFGVPAPLPLGFYGHFLVLGVLCGVGGALFCRAILELQTLYAKLPIPASCRVVIPALLAVVAGSFLPEILGGGHALVEYLGHGSHPASFILLLFVGKLLFTALCFGSGAAGGIFLPMLAVGASL